MYELPTTVTIDGVTLNIRHQGNFRMILDCFEALNDTEMTEQEKIITCLVIFYDDINDIDELDEKIPNLQVAVEEMFKFMNCGSRKSQGMKTDYKLIDWKEDEQIISAAINNVAHTEIRFMNYIHWWTFMGYYLSVGDSLLSTIVGIRAKIKKHEKLEKWEQKFKKENPHYFTWDSRTSSQKELDEYVKSLWNGGEDE